jgi:hypothetical protein
VPAVLHVSRDPRHVASYAQWWSQKDFEAMPKNPEAQQAAIATSFDSSEELALLTGPRR